MHGLLRQRGDSVAANRAVPVVSPEAHDIDSRHTQVSACGWHVKLSNTGGGQVMPISSVTNATVNFKLRKNELVPLRNVNQRFAQLTNEERACAS